MPVWMNLSPDGMIFFFHIMIVILPAPSLKITQICMVADNPAVQGFGDRVIHHPLPRCKAIHQPSHLTEYCLDPCKAIYKYLHLLLFAKFIK